MKLHYQILIAMLLGAGVGLPLNILAEPTPKFELPLALQSDLDSVVVTPALRAAMERNGVTLGSSASVQVKRPGVKWTLTDNRWIYHIAARRGPDSTAADRLRVAYGRIGEGWPRTIAGYGKRVGDVFLRLLSMIVAPLILSSIITGVTSTGNVRGLGRLGGRTLAYYLGTSVIAILTGLLVFTVFQPGRGSDLSMLQESVNDTTAGFELAERSMADTLWDQLFTIIPSNPFASLSDPGHGNILGVIFFSILFGIFTCIVGGDAGDRMTRFFHSAFQVMMRMTMAIIRTAPIGVLGFMLYASAGKGIQVFLALGWYCLTVATGLTIHLFFNLPMLLWILGRRSPREYYNAISPALLTAFSTASSNGTLPLTLTCVEERAGISNRISSFVLPIGATVNMDGTALYEAVAVLFIAQVIGQDLSLAQQLVVAFTSLMVSIGAAGIPHAGTVMMVIVLSAVGLPIEHVGLILAVDRVLDMYRTVVNVCSDATACAVIARFEPADGAARTPTP